MRVKHRSWRVLVTAGVLACLGAVGCGSSSYSGAGAALGLTTRAQTVRPVAVPAGTTAIPPRDAAHYETYGYSAWRTGPGEDRGRKLDLAPANYVAGPNKAQLLSFFSISDIHITDKESPAQVPYFGWAAPFKTAGLFSQAYSPVCMYTTHVLDAAVRTINAVHREAPMDFGMLLGDACNSSQYNELRWFMDVVDGKYITPSSGAHVGADTIDYQKPYQATGIDPSLPWYATIGNHDQYWMGVGHPNDKLQNAFVGSEVLNIGPNLFAPNNSDATGVYVGVVDGTTPYGEVIKGGPAEGFATPPTVAADNRRHSLTTAASSTESWKGEFRNSTSSPAGHGLDPSKIGSLAACYTFEPKAGIPIKVIVLDDTCKSVSPTAGPDYYGSGWVDAERFAWLTGELQKGQDAGQLMILAAHIPINPQTDLFDTTKQPQFYADSYRDDAELIATLHNYPNLILLIAGHRHLNTVTPHPSPDAAHPENGFWEVETPSLRDFPQQFRVTDIRRNSDNSISIVTTDVDPQVEPGSPAARSRGYAIGASRLFGKTALGDTSSLTYNAELVKLLTPAMQAKIASCGVALEAAAAGEGEG